MNLQIKFFQSGCADFISIRFKGNDNKYHNILIDGGEEKGEIYQKTLKKEFQEILNRGEIIDLWVITHIDDDHIGGVLRFIRDIETDLNFKSRVNLSKTIFWFNYSNKDFDTGIKTSNFKGVKQGIRLRDYITQNAIICETITNLTKKDPFFGAEITILSPDSQHFNKLLEKWKKEEIKIIQRESSKSITSTINDYSLKIEEFDLSNFIEDQSEENGSSIAFLFEYDGKRILFLADSHPSVVINSLNSLGYNKTNKLDVDYIKVSHHGSKYNTNDDLLQIVVCNNFIISADGINKHNLPHKEALTRIIKHRKDQIIKFLITHKNDLTKSIFKVDGKINNVTVEFPEMENAIIINS